MKWGNLQQNAKKTFCDIRKQRKMTGDGPAPKPPTAVEEKIINMMQDRPNFSGIAGGFESSMPPIHEINLIRKAQNMHKEIKDFLENYKCTYTLPRANDVHIIPTLIPSNDEDPFEDQIDDLTNYLCANYPRLQNYSLSDVSSLVHNTLKFVINYQQAGTPNTSLVDSEAVVGSMPDTDKDIAGQDSSTIICESVSNSFIELPEAGTVYLINDSSLLPEQRCSNTNTSVCKVPEKKRRKVSLSDLQTMQYEALEKQKIQTELSSKKLKKEIEREELETKNIRLRNTKLRLEIKLLKESLRREQTAMLTSAAVQDD